MARNPRKQIAPSKKHLARVEREQRQTMYILIGSITVIVLVLASIGYGILDQTVLRPIRPVAIVNGEKISTKYFQAQTRYGRYSVIRNAMNAYQFAQVFAGDPTTMQSIANQIFQMENTLVPTTIGEQVLNQLIEDKLIRQEAQRRGITVSKDEIDQALQASFRFYPNGTPTPTATVEAIPTSTLSPLQLTLIPPTPTPTITPTITITPTEALTITLTPGAPTSTPTPSPTPAFTPTATSVLTPTATASITPSPTPYTLEAFQKNLKDTVDSLQKDYNITEQDLRDVIESSLYRQKVMDAIVGDLPRTQEQVWALHILVKDEQLAKDIKARLDKGEDWGTLVSEYSIDTASKSKGGDVGWFGRGKMVKEFEDAAFLMQIGQTSNPVKSEFGYHIIRVLGHENRPLSNEEYQQLRQTKFQEWLDQQRANSKVEIRDLWKEVVPNTPTMPQQIVDFLQQLQQSQSPGQIPQSP